MPDPQSTALDTIFGHPYRGTPVVLVCRRRGRYPDSGLDLVITDDYPGVLAVALPFAPLEWTWIEAESLARFGEHLAAQLLAEAPPA